jgi:hypothetical protein
MSIDVEQARKQSGLVPPSDDPQPRCHVRACCVGPPPSRPSGSACHRADGLCSVTGLTDAALVYPLRVLDTRLEAGITIAGAPMSVLIDVEPAHKQSGLEPPSDDPKSRCRAMPVHPDDCAPAPADPLLGPPSIMHLYHFATAGDLVLIAISFALFLISGALMGCLGLVLSRLFVFGPADNISDIGKQMVLWLGGYLGGGIAVVFTVGSLCALHTRHKLVERWRVAYVRAILRQDIGWYDINQAQNLAARMGESMLNIDKALSVPTYEGFLYLGNLLSTLVISFIFAPPLAAICVGFLLVFVFPASAVLARTLQTRTSALADAYSSAGGYAAEVLGAVRTVSSLGIERLAVAKYDQTLATAEKVAVQTTSKLAFSAATITAFGFYTCAAASLYALSVFEPRLRASAFPFTSPVKHPDDPGTMTMRLCVPAACSSFDPFLLLSAMRSTMNETVRERENARALSFARTCFLWNGS